MMSDMLPPLLHQFGALLFQIADYGLNLRVLFDAFCLALSWELFAPEHNRIGRVFSDAFTKHPQHFNRGT
jgi:hypothetical protein